MRNLYLSILIIISFVIHGQTNDDPRIFLLKQMDNMGYLLSKSPNVDWSPNGKLYGKKVDSLTNIIESTGSMSIGSYYPNWVIENYTKTTRQSYQLVIGIDNQEYKILVIKGALDPTIIATITFSLQKDYGSMYMDDEYGMTRRYVKIGESYIWNSNTNIIAERGVITNMMDYVITFDIRFIDRIILKQIAINYNPITELDSKANAFKEFSNIVNKRPSF